MTSNDTTTVRKYLGQKKKDSREGEIEGGRERGWEVKREGGRGRRNCEVEKSKKPRAHNSTERQSQPNIWVTDPKCKIYQKEQ